MAKLFPITTRVLLPVGSTGGPVKLEYEGAYLQAARLAGGRYDGWAVPVQSTDKGVWAELREGAESDKPLQAFGAELGDELTPVVSVTITPQGPKVRALPIVYRGHPRDTGAGGWNLSAFGEQSGERLSNEEEHKSLSEALARTEQQQQAVTGLREQVDAGLADVTQQQEANNAQTATNLGRKLSPTVAEIGTEAGLYNITSGAEAGQVWERLADGTVERRQGLEQPS